MIFSIDQNFSQKFCYINWKSDKNNLARAKVYQMSLEDDVEQNAKSKLSERTGWSEEIA